MKKNRESKENTTVADIKAQRVKKKLIEQVDQSVREEAEEFLKKFNDDTLTGR